MSPKILGRSSRGIRTGREIAVAEGVASQGPITGTTLNDLTGLSVTYVGEGSPVVVELSLPNITNNVATAYSGNLQITDAANALKGLSKYNLPAVINASIGVFARFRHVALAGVTYTWKARINGGAAGASYTVWQDPTFPALLIATAR
jgi:hypothetical protein